MLSYLFRCFKCFWYFCIFWHFFPILYEVINVDYLPHLKNKSVLPLKNFSFTIKSTAPSNIKCLKNVVLIGPFHFHNVFSIHCKRKVKGFHTYFPKTKTLRSPNSCSMHEELDAIFKGLFLLLDPWGRVPPDPCGICLHLEGGALHGERSTSKFRYCHPF